MLFFFTSALVGGPVEYFYAFEGATPLAESGVLVSLPAAVHPFTFDVGLFPVSKGSQFDLKDAYLAYHRSCAVDWEAFCRVFSVSEFKW